MLTSARGPNNAQATLALNAALGSYISELTMSAISRFGEDPCTRTQAAAHEAGHCILLYALGGEIESAEIRRRPIKGLDGMVARKPWLGMTTPQVRNWAGGIPDHNGNYDLRDQSPEYLASRVLYEMAGVVGEISTKTWHPASSLDETVMAKMTAGQLTIRMFRDWQLTQEQVFAYLTGVTTQYLERHRKQLVELVSLLEERKKLTGKVIHLNLSECEPLAVEEVLASVPVAEEVSV